MKKLKVNKNFTESNESGITLIALIVTIIVLIIIAGISIATLTADNGVLRQTNLAKVTEIEATAREQVQLGCSAMRVAIAEAHSKNNSYSAKDNVELIQGKLKDLIVADTVRLDSKGWSTSNLDEDAGTFDIIYAGDDYKQACNYINATIKYTVTVAQKSIEITHEENSTLKDSNQNDVELDIGADSEKNPGEEGGTDSGDITDLVAGLYTTGTTEMQYSWAELISEGILDSTGKIVSGKESELDGDLIILEELTSLVYGSYKNCSELTKVVIPDTITNIPGGIFKGCTNLANIEIPNTVTSIGMSAFENCDGLTNITIPASIVSFAMDAFISCDALNTVYYEGTLEQWFEIAHNNVNSSPCSNGAALYINNVLVEDVVVPNTIDILNNCAFYGCTSLKSIDIHSSLTSIGNYAFARCSNLSNITMGDNVNSIGSSAFYGCTSLISIEIPDGVASILNGTFSGCSGLQSIVLPQNITSIGALSFYGCSALTRIDFEGTTSQWNGITFANEWNSNTQTYTVYCTDGTVSKSGTVTLN